MDIVSSAAALATAVWGQALDPALWFEVVGLASALATVLPERIDPELDFSKRDRFRRRPKVAADEMHTDARALQRLSDTLRRRRGRIRPDDVRPLMNIFERLDAIATSIGQPTVGARIDAGVVDRLVPARSEGQLARKRAERDRETLARAAASLPRPFARNGFVAMSEPLRALLTESYPPHLVALGELFVERLTALTPLYSSLVFGPFASISAPGEFLRTGTVMDVVEAPRFIFFAGAEVWHHYRYLQDDDRRHIPLFFESNVVTDPSCAKWRPEGTTAAAPSA